MHSCPNCGADLPKNAVVCPECGSDEKTGWSDEAATGGLDLPDDDFNYEEFVEREFNPKPKPGNVHWVWWVTAVLLLAIFLVFFFH